MNKPRNMFFATMLSAAVLTASHDSSAQNNVKNRIKLDLSDTLSHKTHEDESIHLAQPLHKVKVIENIDTLPHNNKLLSHETRPSHKAKYPISANIRRLEDVIGSIQLWKLSSSVNFDDGSVRLFWEEKGWRGKMIVKRDEIPSKRHAAEDVMYTFDYVKVKIDDTGSIMLDRYNHIITNDVSWKIIIEQDSAGRPSVYLSAYDNNKHINDSGAQSKSMRLDPLNRHVDGKYFKKASSSEFAQCVNAIKKAIDDTKVPYKVHPLYPQGQKPLPMTAPPEVIKKMHRK